MQLKEQLIHYRMELIQKKSVGVQAALLFAIPQHFGVHPLISEKKMVKNSATSKCVSLGSKLQGIPIYLGKSQQGIRAEQREGRKEYKVILSLNSIKRINLVYIVQIIAEHT